MANRATTTMVAIPETTMAGWSPNHSAVSPDSNAPSSLEAADEHRLDRQHTATQGVGGGEGHDGGPHEHADHVCGGEGGEQEQGERQAAAEGDTDGEHPEAGDGLEEARPDMALDGSARQDEGGERGAEASRRLQPEGLVVAGVKEFLDDRRGERDDPAEEYSKEIEADRGQQQWCAPNQPQPVERGPKPTLNRRLLLGHR